MDYLNISEELGTIRTCMAEDLMRLVLVTAVDGRFPGVYNVHLASLWPGSGKFGAEMVLWPEETGYSHCIIIHTDIYGPVLAEQLSPPVGRISRRTVKRILRRTSLPIPSDNAELAKDMGVLSSLFMRKLVTGSMYKPYEEDEWMEER
jgi:hypothetical protein